MRTDEFDYHLPEELIAQHPIEKRDESRLMVLHRDSGCIDHRRFVDLIDYIDRGDVLVLNDTRVLPARIRARRARSGGKIELLLLRRVSGNSSREVWEVLVRPGRRAKIGEVLFLGDGALLGEIKDKTDAGGRIVEFRWAGDSAPGEPGRSNDLYRRLLSAGEVPLPPYIKAPLHDPERYQTVYSVREGSVAAPTAGLHFTEALMESIRRKGVLIEYITLHVGLGTFRPVSAELVEEHRMHSEAYSVGLDAAESINRAKATGKRVFAVGTTVARTLETLASVGGHIEPGSGWTDIFIYPGHKWRCVDALVTNFHLPRSTLLMLVCSFGGYENIMAAYKQAIEERYRFYSFGDAMLIL